MVPLLANEITDYLVRRLGCCFSSITSLCPPNKRDYPGAYYFAYIFQVAIMTAVFFPHV